MDDIAVKFVYGLVPMALIKFALPLSAWQDVIYRENDLLFVRCCTGIVGAGYPR